MSWVSRFWMNASARSVGRISCGRVLGGDERTVVSRVERDQLFDRHLGELGGDAEVDVARQGDGDEVRRVRDRIELDPRGRGIGDDVLERLERRHVGARLARHRDRLVVGRLALRPVAVDRALDAVLAHVVRGEREVPVAEHLVQRLQVVERGVGRGEDVAPPVVPEVLVEVVVPAGRGDELPQPRSVRARVRERVVRALDHRQERELGGHPAALERLDDVEEVFPAAVDEDPELLGPLRVPGLPLDDDRAHEVRDREAGADADPEIAGCRLGRRLRTEVPDVAHLDARGALDRLDPEQGGGRGPEDEGGIVVKEGVDRERRPAGDGEQRCDEQLGSFLRPH